MKKCYHPCLADHTIHSLGGHTSYEVLEDGHLCSLWLGSGTSWPPGPPPTWSTSPTWPASHRRPRSGAASRWSHSSRWLRTRPWWWGSQCCWCWRFPDKLPCELTERRVILEQRWHLKTTIKAIMFICLITDTPHDVLGLEQMFLSLRPQALSGGLFPQKEKSHQVIIPETNRRATILIDNAMITLRFWSKIRKNTFHNCFVMMAILFKRLKETT